MRRERWYDVNPWKILLVGAAAYGLYRLVLATIDMAYRETRVPDPMPLPEPTVIPEGQWFR